MDEDWDDPEYGYDDSDDEESELEDAFDECGLLPTDLGGGCQLAGTEHCDFECPFRDNLDELLGGEDG